MLLTLGTAKLRGHKDSVTGLSELSRGARKLLVSVSKDTLLKVYARFRNVSPLYHYSALYIPILSL